MQAPIAKPMLDGLLRYSLRFLLVLLVAGLAGCAGRTITPNYVLHIFGLTYSPGHEEVLIDYCLNDYWTYCSIAKLDLHGGTIDFPSPDFKEFSSRHPRYNKNGGKFVFVQFKYGRFIGPRIGHGSRLSIFDRAKRSVRYLSDNNFEHSLEQKEKCESHYSFPHFASETSIHYQFSCIRKLYADLSLIGKGRIHITDGFEDRFRIVQLDLQTNEAGVLVNPTTDFGVDLGFDVDLSPTSSGWWYGSIYAMGGYFANAVPELQKTSDSDLARPYLFRFHDKSHEIEFLSEDFDFEHVDTLCPSRDGSRLLLDTYDGPPRLYEIGSRLTNPRNIPFFTARGLTACEFTNSGDRVVVLTGEQDLETIQSTLPGKRYLIPVDRMVTILDSETFEPVSDQFEIGQAIKRLVETEKGPIPVRRIPLADVRRR